MKRIFNTAILILGWWLLGQGVYMDAKAKVAQVLIASSWENRSEGSPAVRPWWWADTRALAQLDVPRLNQTLYVMQDDTGESLAFGPGHMPASSALTENGHVVIAGHRDSHFSFLRDVKMGDLIVTQNSQAKNQQYRVIERLVIDTTKEEIQLLDYAQLTLITCYPFDEVIPGGPLRLVIHAEPVNDTQLALN